MSAERFDMGRVRTRLLLDQPFFGTLAMHLEMVENPAIETLRTDGVRLEFNPAFLATLTPSEQLGVLAHEVLHPALLHPWRRAGRDLREWNEACDYAINAQLIAAGFTLPAGALLDPQFDGMSAEQIFSKRRSQEQPPQQEPEGKDDDEGDDTAAENDDTQAGDDEGDDGDGDDEGDGDGQGASESSMPGCPTGEFVDGPETAEAEGDLTASDWEVIAEEAATVAARAGELPGETGRAIKETREARVDWKAELRAFVTNTVESDYSWSSPNRRFVSRGLYLPGAVKENVGAIVVGVDVSGSITQAQLDEFAAELTGLMRDAQPEKLVAVYCDTRVCAVNEFTPDDVIELRLPANAGGGTLFQPVFDYVEAEQLDPLALVYLTDLEAAAPQIPPYPVLWTTPAWCQYPAPFGQLVRIE